MSPLGGMCKKCPSLLLLKPLSGQLLARLGTWSYKQPTHDKHLPCSIFREESESALKSTIRDHSGGQKPVRVQSRQKSAQGLLKCTCTKMVKKLVDPQYHKLPRPMMVVQPFLSRFATLTMCIGPFSGIAKFHQR
jgi:hypothetical protein